MAGMAQEDIDRISALIKTVAANRTVLMVEHNLSVVADCGSHHGADARPGAGRRRLRRRCRPIRRCSRPTSDRATNERVTASRAAARRQGPRKPGTANSISCTASTSMSRRRGGHAARPQRRRQDHHDEVDHGHRRQRTGSVRSRAANIGLPSARSRGRHRAIARGARHLLEPRRARKISCCRRRCGRADSTRPDLRAVSQPRERLSSQGTKLSGGEQQMLAIGAHPADRRATAVARRAHRGLAPVIIEQIRQTIGAQGAGLYHAPGRAEFPLRGHRRGPALRHGARSRRRRITTAELEANMGEAARVSRSLMTIRTNGQHSKPERGRMIRDITCQPGVRRRRV